MIKIITSLLEFIVIAITIILFGYLAISLINIEIASARNINKFIKYLENRLDEENRDKG